MSGNISPISTTSSSSSSDYGTSKSDVKFLAHLKALTSNPEKIRIEEDKLELERKKVDIENRRLAFMEQSSADMKDFIKQTMEN